MMVKVCGITRREDAEAAVTAGASALGFVFYPQSPRYVSPDAAAELGRGLDVWKVGVFVEETAALIEAVMRAARLDVAQIYGGSAPAGARVWKAFRVNQAIDSTPLDGAEAILLDGPANGVVFDWKKIVGGAAPLVRSRPPGRLRRDHIEQAPHPHLIVAGGLDASNVAEAIRTAKPWGVDASSRLEISPGVKDHEKVRQFVQAALKAQ
jgi:phosphoribosylanthranilate isomerase